MVDLQNLMAIQNLLWPRLRLRSLGLDKEVWTVFWGRMKIHVHFGVCLGKFSYSVRGECCANANAKSQNDLTFWLWVGKLGWHTREDLA